MTNHSNLSFSELERNAYANGDFATLAIYGPAVDLEEDVSLYESQIDSLEKDAQTALDNHNQQMESAEEDLLEARLQRDKAKCQN